eukprot:923394_1
MQISNLNSECNEMALAYDKNKSLNDCLDEIGYKDHEAHLEYALKQVALNDMYNTVVKDDERKPRLRNRKSKHKKQRRPHSASGSSEDYTTDTDLMNKEKSKFANKKNWNHDYCTTIVKKYYQSDMNKKISVGNILTRAMGVQMPFKPQKMRSVFDLRYLNDPLLP